MITAAQVANATKGQLLQITYELLLESIDTMKQHVQVNDQKEFEAELGHARRILQELIDTLDFKEEISKNLMQLYVYINGLFIKSTINYDGTLLDEAKAIIHKLLEGWNEVIARESASTKVMNNTQQLYAGLTYGKGNLNEAVLDDTNRGFKA